MSAVAKVNAIPRLTTRGRVTQGHVVRSEWTKLVTLRSTRWSLIVAVVLGIGLPLLFAALTSSHWGGMSPHERADRNPLDIAQAGVYISQLAIGILGVLVITGEYSTGMIRATFTAVPKRLPVLWAKLGVYAVVSCLLMLPSVRVAFFASQAILSRHDILQISFSQSGVARAVVGGALYLMLLGMLAMAIGSIVRNTAGGIAAFAAIFFVTTRSRHTFPTPPAGRSSRSPMTRRACPPPPASHSSSATSRSRSRLPQSYSCAATRRTACAGRARTAATVTSR